MSKKLLTLSDRYITNTGDVVFTYDGLLKLARDGQEFHQYLVDENEYTEIYNRFSSNKLEAYEEDETVDVQFEYDWNTPEPFASMDITKLCAQQMVNLDLTSDEYLERLHRELTQIEKREMTDLIRHLLYLVDHFKTNEVVWGVGRGSSCASLVLFLLGINKIDPIMFDIPMEEFLR